LEEEADKKDGHTKKESCLAMQGKK
jgi:hypothetical protein